MIFNGEIVGRINLKDRKKLLLPQINPKDLKEQLMKEIDAIDITDTEAFEFWAMVFKNDIEKYKEKLDTNDLQEIITLYNDKFIIFSNDREESPLKNIKL